MRLVRGVQLRFMGKVVINSQILDFGEKLFASFHQRLCSRILLEVNLQVAMFISHIDKLCGVASELAGWTEALKPSE